MNMQNAEKIFNKEKVKSKGRIEAVLVKKLEFEHSRLWRG
jgi:hypothetical protein